MMNQDGNQERILQCLLPQCDWTYPCSFGSEESYNLIKMHMEYAHPQPERNSHTARAPKFDAPTIDAGIDQEAWIAFTIRWQQYCQGSGISRELQSLRLFQCASQGLGTTLLQYKRDITDCAPEVVLEELRKFAVIPTVL